MKSILTIILTLSFITSINSQTMDRREDFVFGLKAGTNFSNVWDESGDEFVAEGKFGFAGGAYFGIPLGTYIGIQPEVLFSQKGYRGSGSVPLLGSYEYTRTTNHLDIPIQLQIKPSEFLTIVAGPQYSYILSQRRRI